MELDYTHKTQPFKHQEYDFLLSRNFKLWADNSEMGCGKSKVLIDTAAWLFNEGKITGLLVVAPKGVYRNWISQIELHMPDKTERNVVAWNPAKTKRQAEAMNSLYERKFERLNVLLMNVEAFATARGCDAARHFLNWHPSLFAIDESTTIKNRDAQRTKALLTLSKYAPYRRILTGSPITQSPLDLYSQCAFLDPRLLGYTSYYAFRARYANLESMSIGERKIQKVVSYKNLDELGEKLATFSVRNLKRDCLDLPPKVYETREVEMTASQREIYNEMRDAAQIIIDQETATAKIALTQVLRLQQITCGFLKLDEGRTTDLSTTRVDALMELLEECSGKVIVWAHFRHSLSNILNAVFARYGPGSCVSYYGDTSYWYRDAAIKAFQEDDNTRFFVGNPQTGGYGLTLTAASTVVYFSNSYKLEERLQSEDRAHRAGQTKSVTYVDLLVPGTVDRQVLTALKEKKHLAELVMGDDWRIE